MRPLILCLKIPPVGWHIAVELVVSLSVCASEKFNIGHNFCNIEDSNLIFCMHVYVMELHILSGERSRSSFKVLGQNTFFLCVSHRPAHLEW
jgi:hypothetical protein